MKVSIRISSPAATGTEKPVLMKRPRSTLGMMTSSRGRPGLETFSKAAVPCRATESAGPPMNPAVGRPAFGSGTWPLTVLKTTLTASPTPDIPLSMAVPSTHSCPPPISSAKVAVAFPLTSGATSSPRIDQEMLTVPFLVPNEGTSSSSRTATISGATTAVSSPVRSLTKRAKILPTASSAPGSICRSFGSFTLGTVRSKVGSVPVKSARSASTMVKSMRGRPAREIFSAMIGRAWSRLQEPATAFATGGMSPSANTKPSGTSTRDTGVRMISNTPSSSWKIPVARI